MRKAVLILLVLMVSAPVYAGQYLETFESVLYGAREALNVDTAETGYLPDTTGHQRIREGLTLVNPQLKGDKGTYVSTTTYRQNTYTLDSLFVGVLSVEWAKNDSTKSLMYVPRELWYEQEHKQTSGDGQKDYLQRPSYYDYSEDQLFVYPAPTIIGDSLKVYGWKRVGDIDTVSTLSAIPEAHRTVIKKYVVWQTALAKDHPREQSYWNDFKVSAAAVNVIYNNRGRLVPTDTE